nr:uncharacterized protein LOC123497090 [Aegilops tauschii subsp. strangulata]
MGNSKSTAVLKKGVIDDEYNPNTIPVSEHFDDIYATEPVLTSVENVEEYNAGIIPVADNVDDTSTTELDGSKLLRIDDAHDSSLSAMSIRTLNFGTPVAQHGNGQEPFQCSLLESFENNKDNTTNLQDENEEDTTCEQKATGSVFFERNKSADQARKQFNAQKRAAYRNKKDENMVRLQKENQPSLPKTVYWHIRHDDNADDIDVFLSDIMGDEPTGPNLMDEEYYMFRNQGSDNDSMDDESEATMTGGNPSEIDPFHFVYSNIPDNTHILKLAANCEHCKARKFESETDGFCCRMYKGVVDAITSGETRASAVGTRIVLPGTYPGGDRDMKKRHMDAMAIVHTYGKPDIFLTMTCNPKWEEITNELLPGQTAQDRPDIVARVFYGKLEAMKYMLFKKHILGVVVAYVYVVEFQKRGLPHAHFLLIMDSTYKLVVPEQYDRLISAELPNKQKYPELHALVIPAPFNENTAQGKDSYPVYRRRDDGSCAKVRGKMLDNRWVVPYNPYLLRMFNCHINVEVCSSIKAVKYLYKYIYKGHDKASFSIDQPDADGNIDEIKRYVDARWVTPPEAMWRIFGFPLCANYPPVLQLPLHLPNMHRVAFNAQADLKNVVASENASKSMLTEYFKANQEHPRARHILYKDFPGSFTWQKKKKFWKPRVERFQIGRIVSANPAEGERYYLRVLLNHVTGKTSFDDLLTVDGVLCGSFRDAAERLGLIEADNTLDDCLTEAEQWAMPCSLRRLFATILVHCEPGDVRGLWDRHLEPMSDDYRRTRTSPNEVEQMVLLDIRGMLQSMGKDIVDFALPSIDDAFDPTEGEAREVIEESTVEFDVDDTKLASSLNLEQRAAYDEILAAVERGDGGVFFVDGPGGTGKTFLYRAMLAKVRSDGKIGIATATSGVAASIMPGGRTAHSRFKIPLSCDDGASCSFTKQSGTAKLLRMASLIIWDEASMTKRQAVEALDNSMRDIMGIRDRPFGGKTVVFGGDFRQVLPVVRRGSRGQIIDATLRSSHLWKGMRQLRLITNMRAHNDTWFADYLLRVGNGTEDVDDQGNILLPEDICLPSTGEVDDLEKLIDHVFPSLDDNMSDSNYMTSRAILSTTNDNVDKINIRMIERFHGDEVIYHSFDSAEDDPYGYYAQEFLNGLTPNGLPPHALKLKLNCPVILLRNIDPANGLCNGTRLVVRGFERNTIDAEIVIGQHAGRRVFLPRIPLCPSENDMFPFKFKRKQFPIRLSFAMTINKAQGQTIPIVGVYLPNPVFSHGQLYVALSRATVKRNIKILIQKEKPKEKANKQKDNPKKRKRPTVSLLTSMKNIVYKEVLTG